VLLAAALLALGGSQAFADENGRRLIIVTADTPSKIDQLQDRYDVGYVGEPTEAAVYLDSDEEAILRAQGYELGEVVEDHKTWLDRRAEIDATTEREKLAKQFAQRGIPKAGVVSKGKRIVALPGEVVIMRAYTFTNYAGRFLYVEAHDRDHTTNSGPALQMAYAGPDGVYRPPYAFTTNGIAPDANDNPTGGNKLNDAGQYMYHRILRPLLGADANLSAQDITVRVASSTGAFDTSSVTEWAGSQLPARVAEFQKDFITKYMDPTEVYGRIDQIAHDYPGIAEIVNLPEKTAGYQRKSQAIMSGTNAIGSAPAAQIGDPVLDTTGEITEAAPVAAIPFTATAGQTVLATVDGIPSGSTDFILRLRDPNGTVLQTVDTGTSPEIINRTLTTAGTYTYEVLGFQGDLGDFTFKIQPVTGSAATAQAAAVVLTSKAWGHQGGNQIRAEFRNPGTPDSPLTVAVAPNDITGSDITVNLATSSTGALTSTAGEVVAAINASPPATALVSATTWAGNAGAGVVAVRPRVALSDFLNAPPSVQRGPFQQRVLRIGKQRDGSKVGVFIYCQQHAREWVTPITCLETAERLVRNYAIDPTTRAYVDNLDIFILPSSNPDGAHYSMYDSSVQRKNLTNYCPNTATNGMPSGRNAWGVDLNRNNTLGTLFDGYSGASTSCSSETYAGPFEKSEVEIRNEQWVVDTFPKIKFAINIHTHGGYFMWAPGAYKSAGRVTLPAPNIGIEKYFFDVSETILSHIKSSRGTVVLPQRTGPIADVLYSAAGNSSDEAYYRRGIIAYSFEAGAQRISVNSTSGAITREDVGFQPCFKDGVGGGSTGFCRANTANEGHDSAMEFADGNYGLLQGALEYERDTAAPVTAIDSDGLTVSNQPINYKFTWPGESAVIRYTTDGSTPTAASPTYNNQGPRRPGEVLTVANVGTTTVKWFGTDIKNNTEAVRSQTFVVDQTAPEITITNPADGAVFTQGRPVPVAYGCTDAGGATVAECTGGVANGALLPTGTAGTQTFTVTARDTAGNVTTKTVSYRVLDATNVGGSVGGSVSPTLALTLGVPATFAPFTPGVDGTYSAGTTATVVSTAGDAALSVADPSSVNTGKLMNGTFTLAQALQAQATSPGGTGSAFAPVGGSVNPTTLLTYAAPKSNDVVAIAFKQVIGRTEGLRTGSYSKTLTFTLSTTTP
jgi:hypothetical protein